MTNFRTQTFTANNGQATVTVRESTAMDLIDSQVLYAKLPYDRKNEYERNRARNFVNWLLRSTVEGDIGFIWPQSGADESAYQAAFEAWQGVTAADLANWQTALTQVDTPPLGQAPPAKAHNKRSSDG